MTYQYRPMQQFAHGTVSVQPFVLRCPECSAPAKLHQTTCEYCKVALTWHSQLRPDDYDDNLFEPVDDEPLGEVLTFGPKVIPAQTETTFQGIPQITYRPHAIWIDRNIAPSFLVKGIGVGTLMKLLSPVPATMFSATRLGTKIDLGTVNVGQFITMTIENIDMYDRAFMAVMRGTVRDPFEGRLFENHRIPPGRRVR